MQVRGARWEEVEFGPATWAVPASRMKMARPHGVSLFACVVEVLEKARELSDDAGLVFSLPTGRMLSDSTIPRLVQKNSIGCVPHGMRSSCRDWAAERSDGPREVREPALAPVNSDRVEAAHRRSELFEKRREPMADWANHLAQSPC